MRTSIIVLFTFLAGQTVVCNGKVKSLETNNPIMQIIMVGLKDADINGADNLSIQAAIDLLSNRGGGTVKILPGEYTLYNSIYLRSNVNITGDKEGTILKRCPAVSSRLLVDADVFEKQIIPTDPSLFKVGMGIVCRSNDLMNAMITAPLTITSIENGKLYLNNYIPFDFTADLDSHGKEGYDGLVANVFPMLLGNRIENVIIDGLTINSFVNEDLGWQNVRTGGIFFGTCKNSVIRNVKVSNTQGDGVFIADASYNITVENCESAYNTYHGVHAGSHSTFVTVRNCNIHHNGSDGIYICWGIKNSRFTENEVHHNGTRKVGKRNGISIGHKDNYNLIEGNHIYENAVSGIHFREKTEANGAHFNTIKGNTIENNGLPGHTEKGYGIFISGITHDIVMENNVIRETRQGDSRLQKSAIVLSKGVSQVKMINNEMNGHPEDNIVDNSK